MLRRLQESGAIAAGVLAGEWFGEQVQPMVSQATAPMGQLGGFALPLGVAVTGLWVAQRNQGLVRAVGHGMAINGMLHVISTAVGTKFGYLDFDFGAY